MPSCTEGDPRPDDDSAIAGGGIHVKVSRRPSLDPICRAFTLGEYGRTTKGLTGTFSTTAHHYALIRSMSPICKPAIICRTHPSPATSACVRTECCLGSRSIRPCPTCQYRLFVVSFGPYCARDRSDCQTFANTRHSLLREI